MGLPEPLSKEEKEELRKLKKMKDDESKRKRMESQGVKEFFYENGEFVLARNQRNADKKARKKGYLKD